jgi:hypothetical protein
MLISIASFGLCEHDEASDALTRWKHFLGPCDRPFGMISYGLWWESDLVGVAISASTVNGACGGYERKEVVELARLCCHPQYRDLSRVILRLWRKAAFTDWEKYWPVTAYVSYANAIRHTGNLYRFDGWTKIADVRGGTAGGNRAGTKTYEPKSVWTYPLAKTAAVTP